MSFLNYYLINKIPNYYKKALGYYPDMLVYQHNATQYAAQWQSLIQAKYIYTNGYDLKPVSIFRYAFEIFKGWLGFNNHCEQQKVKLSLCKFAYYGYLQNYSQSHLQQPLLYCNLPTEYLTLVQKPRDGATSKALQTLLIKYYWESASLLPQSPDFAVHTQYAFGDCFKLLGQWTEIPRLDPQSPLLINNTINKLEFELAIKNYTFFAKSYYAQLAAQSYLNKAQEAQQSYLYHWTWLSNAQARTHAYLKQALSFNPDITRKDLIIFIDYFLKQHDFAQALTLIDQLPNINDAINYVVANFTTREQLTLITPNSNLAKALAKYYLQQNKLESLRLAVQLDTNLDRTDPVNRFKLFIAEEEDEKAYELWLANQDKHTFTANDLRKLADYFDEAGEQAYQIGKKYRQTNQWEPATLAYKQSLLAKEKALKIEPNIKRQEQYYVHTRLYAQLLIDADLNQNKPTESDINNIQKAINLLDRCDATAVSSEERLRHSKTLVKGLMRQVDYLTSIFSVSSIYDRDHDTQLQHKKKHQDDFELAIKALHRIVKLLKDTKSPKQKKLLGKAYFLLGDIAYFFDLDSYNAPSYFKKAMETVPKNPFYLLRCSELFPEQQENLRERGVPLLKELGFSAHDYTDWDLERWEKKEIGKKSPIKDIHNLEVKQPPKVTTILNFS
ncbi:hypothetical protein ACNVED_02255 [Legionella sp. D16C41]|uniref:hypothetical protein n=1 Tax=Legionella sp. D16C41 TaxID=3402688 RepID=UPI003AF73836